MHPFAVADWMGFPGGGGFMGRVFDEWGVDGQEFVRTKLPASDRRRIYRFCPQSLAARHHGADDRGGRAARGEPRAGGAGKDAGRGGADDGAGGDPARS